MNRRRFIGLAATTALASAVGRADPTGTQNDTSADRVKAPRKLHAFDFEGVRLLPSPFVDRLTAARAFYLGVPDNDILIGFRRAAGMPAPGRELGGWCNQSSALLFGQWLSGMARLQHVSNDHELAAKAANLTTEWGKTLPKQRFGHYDYDKFACGLVDMAKYANHPDALSLLGQMTAWAEANLGRARLNASDADTQGGFFNGQLEWYTLPENLYRAYLLTGDDRYRKFAEVWHYPNYWGMFNGQIEATPDGFHAYSHCNALSSAAAAYAVTGDTQFLKTIIGGHDYFRRTQCYATGGYGPGEKLMAPNGALGESIVVEPNEKYLGHEKGRSFETPCGTWAVFKLCRYLQEFTGEARFGDWMEMVLYNGIGAIPWIRGRGETFYYADYRLAGGRKHTFSAHFPCCAGTYLQDVAEFYNLIYYRDPAGIAVNLYIPSEVAWTQEGEQIQLRQVTTYPDSEAIDFTLTMNQPAEFTLQFRIPGWADGASVKINGKYDTTTATAGDWLTLHREWQPGDRIVLRLPLYVREIPIDTRHPHRVAYARGPHVLVRPAMALPPPRSDPFADMVSFASFGEGLPYRMYVDKNA